jgi:NAD-dependent SIR2 family protein deacetylase
MGAKPSKPTDEQREELEATKSAATEGAAATILESNAIILMTGAGWSADSGLSVYADVANVKAYHDRALTYRQLCQPSWLNDDPETFHGFWGKCFNDYRDVSSHAGYGIVAKWRDELAESKRGQWAGDNLFLASGAPGSFFCFTSNVDAHSLRHFSPLEVRECHGNSETWQCFSSNCQGFGNDTKHRWPAPPEFRFRVDPESALAPSGPPERAASVTHPEADAFDSNWPRCMQCGGKARPSILMFGDGAFCDDEEQENRWREWLHELEELARVAGPSFRVTIVEAGAGGNVTTVRNKSESILGRLQTAGATATLVRINPELPFADQVANQPHTFSLLSKGLDAIRAIDDAMNRQRTSDGPDGPVGPVASMIPPVLQTVEEEKTAPVDDDAVNSSDTSEGDWWSEQTL